MVDKNKVSTAFFFYSFRYIWNSLQEAIYLQLSFELFAVEQTVF